LPPDADQFTQQRQVIDLLRQLARCEEPGAVLRQLRQIAGAAQLAQRLIAFEIGLQRNWAGGGVAFQKLENTLIDALVERLEKMFRPQRGAQFFDHAIVDQDRAKEGGLGFDIGRQPCGLCSFGFSLGPGNHIGFGHAPLLRAGPAEAKGQCWQIWRTWLWIAGMAHGNA